MSGIVVCNTGPLIALSLIKRVDILRSLFDVIAIPEEVRREVLQGKTAGGELATWTQPEWISVLSLSKPIDPLLKTLLHSGEAAVVSLAQELRANFVLLDERKARKIARTVYGLEVIGSARVLVEAKRRALIDNVGDAVKRMRDGGYWISDSVLKEALHQVGEK
jgi:hypothetical protein